jgi:hypothetical protein
MDQCRVAPVDAVSGVGEPVDRFTVGGQEEQARGVHVEAAHVGETGGVGNEVEDGAPPFLIGGGGNHAQRLVEGEPAPGTLLHLASRDGDALAVGVHLHADGRHGAVHPHLALPNQLFRGPARRDSRAGERPLEPHLGHDSAST